LKVSCISIMLSRRGSINRIGTHDSPSAKAIGTRMNIKKKNPPNRTRHATPGDNTDPVMTSSPQQS